MRPVNASARPRPALRVAAGLAVGLHLAAGLAWWLSLQARTVSPLVPASRPAWSVVLPRPLTTQALAQVDSGPNSAARQAPPKQQARSAPTAAMVPRDPSPQAVAPPVADAVPPATTAEGLLAASSGAQDVDVPAAPLAEAPYYARAELDVGPAPQAPVLIAFPVGMATGSRQVGRLSLFIDETGTVRNVAILPTEPPLPEAMEDAARRAFLATRFAPGQRQGAIVRSRIDIEVSFDDRPLDNLEAEAPKPSPQAAQPGPRTSGA
jgi:hypothetical protein